MLKTEIDKPSYCVPSMADIEALPWNGFNVASTFSGCGGSCLGYRMAGFRVLWASEFVPAAQEVYKLNHPDSILDTRDIRQVQPQDILDATGLGVGDIDILDGSPPCASFSTAGKRERDWGKVKAYSDTKQRTDDLFFEYVRILNGLQPKVFVAENVSGLIKGTAKGYFIQILKAMKACGYQVTAKLLDAQPDVVVDLGCSRGEAIAALAERLTNTRFVGIEISEPMLEAARERFEGFHNVDIRNLDLRTDYPAESADVTLCVLTLQFTPMEYRLQILKRIYEHTRVLILVEKVLGATADLDAQMVTRYYALKGQNGYSPEQIERKRLSLEGVLVPVTAKWNEELLRLSGFTQVDCFWRWMNFAGWIAVR